MGILTIVVVMMMILFHYYATYKCSAFCQFKFNINEHGLLVSQY